MEYRITVPVTTEPLTLAEVKQHSRLDSSTFAGDIAAEQSIAPGGHEIAASFSLKGAAVDVLGKIALVTLNSGACGAGGSISAKIQEADTDSESYYQDFTGGAFTNVTEENDNNIQILEYTGSKQYIRVVATVAAAACSFSSEIIAKTGVTLGDVELEALISAAREYCENRLSRALATQTIETYFNDFPSKDYIELPRPPLQSVSSVKYLDSNGTEHTLTEGTDYLVDTLSNVGRIVLPDGKSWPTATLYPLNPIRITLIAGYNESNIIPNSIKLVMKMLVAHWNENREAVMTGAINMTKAIEFAVDALLPMYKVRWFS